MPFSFHEGICCLRSLTLYLIWAPSSAPLSSSFSLFPVSSIRPSTKCPFALPASFSFALGTTTRNALRCTAANGSVPDALSSVPSIIFQTSAALVAYVSTVTYFDRPRGELVVGGALGNPFDFLVTRPSGVDGAGFGLFARRPMHAGTFLGTYPGVLRPLEKYMQGKLKSSPESAAYVWRFTDNKMVIDPTDDNGSLPDVCFGGTNDLPVSKFLLRMCLPWLLSVPTVLARVNEPPPGKDCNVFATEDIRRRRVVFTLCRDVMEGEELFMDYGLTYDRTGYSGQLSGSVDELD